MALETTRFDIADYLKTRQDVAACLEAVARAEGTTEAASLCAATCPLTRASHRRISPSQDTSP